MAFFTGRPMHYFFISWKFKILFLASCAVFPAAALAGAAFASVYYASLSASFYSLYCSRLGMLDSVKLELQEMVRGVYPAYFDRVSFIMDCAWQARLYETLSFALLIYAAIASIAFAAGGNGRRSFAARVVFVSAVFLAAGLFAPSLAIKATGEIPVIGGTGVLKFEAKGIAETISRLFGSGYPLPATLILLFSVITPAAKIALCYMAIERGGAGYASALRAIGKWSMADVFAVSIILAYLAFGADKFTDAWLLSGFYFFCGYCLISLAAVPLATGAGEGHEKIRGGEGAGRD